MLRYILKIKILKKKIISGTWFTKLNIILINYTQTVLKLLHLLNMMIVLKHKKPNFKLKDYLKPI